MIGLARWRAGALVAMAAGAVLPLVLAQRERGRYERALAARDAAAAAAYLAIVTPPPPARGGAGYDLPLPVPPRKRIHPAILAANILDLTVGHFVLAALNNAAARNDRRVLVEHNHL